MIEVGESSISTAQAERVYELGVELAANDLPSVACSMPSIQPNDELAVPVLGTQFVRDYEFAPCSIGISTNPEKSETLISLTSRQGEIAVPLYGPDRMTREERQRAASGRTGYAALRGWISFAPGAERSGFQLFGEEPESGAWRALPYSNDEATTFVGALRGAVASKLYKQRSAQSLASK